MKYARVRRGKDGKPFTIYKLQIMRPAKDDASAADNKELDKFRLTRLGVWLDEHSLNELPQIFNVIKGDLAFIGPRPLLEASFPKIAALTADGAAFKRWMAERQRVLPGVTGWQQAHTEHTIDPDTVSYDLEYLHNPTALKDIYALAKTPLIALVGRRRYFSKERRPAAIFTSISSRT